MVEREAERLELSLIPARANAQDQAATRDLLDGVRDFGQEGGIAECRADDERSQLSPVRDRCQRRKLRHALPRAARFGVGRAVNQVVRDPDGVNADHLTNVRHYPRVRPARGLAVELPLVIRQEQSHLQRPRPLCP